MAVFQRIALLITLVLEIEFLGSGLFGKSKTLRELTELVQSGHGHPPHKGDLQISGSGHRICHWLYQGVNGCQIDTGPIIQPISLVGGLGGP